MGQLARLSGGNEKVPEVSSTNIIVQSEIYDELPNEKIMLNDYGTSLLIYIQ